MQDRDGYIPVDLSFNKCVVYRALDGIITMSFAGLAYIGGSPADEWIVETLTGESLGPLGGTDRRMLGIRTGGGLPRYAIAQVIWRLKEALAKAIAQSSPQPFELALAGFRERRGRVWPFWAEIVKPSKKPLRLSYLPQRGPLPRGKYAASGNGQMADDDVKAFQAHLNKLAKSIQQAHQRDPSVDEVAASMVERVRMIAAQRSTVGPNVLTVALTRAGGYSQFHGVQKFPLFVMRGQTRELWVPNSAQTPWVVGDGVLSSAAFNVGDQFPSMGTYPFRIIGAVPEPGPQGHGTVTMASTSIRRASEAELERRHLQNKKTDRR